MNMNQITETCRRLPRNQTLSEEKLWHKIRNRKINGLKFLRQHPFIYQNDKSGLSYFIADFYCAEKRTVIELDGKIHLDQKEYDLNRDDILRGLKIKVYRFRNEDLDKVIEFIRRL